jgi:hypothetical protein
MASLPLINLQFIQDGLVKSPLIVIPASAGMTVLIALSAIATQSLRWNDKKRQFTTFYEFIV